MLRTPSTKDYYGIFPFPINHFEFNCQKSAYLCWKVPNCEGKSTHTSIKALMLSCSGGFELLGMFTNPNVSIRNWTTATNVFKIDCGLAPCL